MENLTVPPEYRWKMNNGPRIRPMDMRNGHLFNTVVMLWHHFMPPEAVLFSGYRQWRFPDSFDCEVALRGLVPELLNRGPDGFTPFQIAALDKMAVYLRSKNAKLGEILRLT